MSDRATWSLRSADAGATAATGRALADLVRCGDVILLAGDLGTGKTVLAKGLGEGLGVVEPVTSPTFNILLVHEGRLPFYHLDLYRLDDPEDLADIDYAAVVEGDGVALVEWGDRFGAADVAERLLVTITIEGDTARCLAIEGKGRRGIELAESWVSACGSLPGVEAVDAP